MFISHCTPQEKKTVYYTAYTSVLTPHLSWFSQWPTNLLAFKPLRIHDGVGVEGVLAGSRHF